MFKKVVLSEFGKKLLFWNEKTNKRKMPWKGEKDPYKIWLSEIILQQTRVEQGLEYYNKFIKHYPTVEKLASAPEDEVFKMWEGLGYYSRCKNLISTAKFISFQLAGVFPKKYEEIIALKGVGPYTAAAIASFAYNLPFAVVDGNVLRVLARFFGIKTPIDSTQGRKYFNELAQDLLDKNNAGLYNQTLMDFGATVCKPALPLCDICILNNVCIALKENLVKELPKKQNKLIKTKRFFYYIVADYGSKIYVKKRTEKDIWQSLWEFVLVEESNKIESDDFIESPLFKNIVGVNAEIKNVSPIYKQQLTHQTIEGCFIVVRLTEALASNQYQAVSKKELKSLAFPRFITNYFEKNSSLT